MDKELESAVKELEEETEKSEQKKEEESHVGLLAKSVEVLSKAVSSILKKSEGKEEPVTTGAETLSKSMTESEQGQVIDGEEVLKAFQVGIEKSLSTVEENMAARLAQIENKMNAALEVMLPLVKSQLAIHKMVEASPKSMPMLGVLTNGAGREEVTPIRKSGRPLREEAALGIESAVGAGKLEPSYLGRFNSRPEETLRLIPDDVRKSFNIPDTLKQAA